MKLYLAIETVDMLMSGASEEVLGVYSNKTLAYKALENQEYFEYATNSNHLDSGWTYIYDGEMVYYWRIEEVTLDKARNE